MRIIATCVFVASLTLVSHGQERKIPLTLENIERLFRARLPDETLAIEIDERGVNPLLPWREIQRLRKLGVGPSTMSALERFIQLSTLTLVVEPPLAGLLVSVAYAEFGDGEADRSGISDSSGKVVIDGLRQGTYRLNLTPPPTHRFVAREIVLDSDEGVEHIELLPAPAMLSILTRDARVEIGSLGSYNSPFRDLEVPAGTYMVSVYKANHITYRTPISVEPGDQRLLTPVLRREPVKYPVVHRHNWARCWGTLFISEDTIEYRQLGKHSASSGSTLTGSSGEHSFEVPVGQISEVGQWSPNQFKIILRDGTKYHFAHGVLKAWDVDDGPMLENMVDIRPMEPIIESIRRAQRAAR